MLLEGLLDNCSLLSPNCRHYLLTAVDNADAEMAERHATGSEKSAVGLSINQS